MTEPDLSPAAFFDLEATAHPALFSGLARPWEALGDRLDEYLRELLAAPGPSLQGRVADGAFLVGDAIRMEAGSIVEPGAFVQGPCVIGEGAVVRHGAYLRGRVLVAAGGVVGHATEAKGAILLEGAKAAHFAYVGDSILGRNVNLGAGTKLANLKLLGDEVEVRCGGRRVPTGRRKLGAILGDNVQTGCNSVTNPGTVLGPGALVSPCAVVSGWYPARAVIRAR